MTNIPLPEQLQEAVDGSAPPLEGGGEALIAFSEALNAVENIARTQTADTGKYTYRYADLADVLGEVKRCCQMFHLAVTQNGTANDGMLAVTTTLIHRSGQWLTFPAMMLRMPGDAQALGSALTYLRRYSLLTIFGIAPEDDDGRAATQAERTVQDTGGFRSEAERLFHEEMQAMPIEHSRAMRVEFKAVFGQGLSDLPISKHGDALTWLRHWTYMPPATADVPPAGDVPEATAQGSAAQAVGEGGATETAPVAPPVAPEPPKPPPKPRKVSAADRELAADDLAQTGDS